MNPPVPPRIIKLIAEHNTAINKLKEMAERQSNLYGKDACLDVEELLPLFAKLLPIQLSASGTLLSNDN